MDTAAFMDTIAEVYGGDLLNEVPTDRRFRTLMDSVEGMGSENKLALLNHAAGLIDRSEAYVEVGTWKGLSLIAATLGNDAVRIYAFDDFSEAHSDSDELRRVLRENLDSYGLSDRIEFAEGDAFRLLSDTVREPIGVYFYDGDHSLLAHHLALAVVEPHLADEALVIIDDAAWPSVRYATERYVRRHQGYTKLLDLPSRGDFDPRWWTGVVVYRWRRPAGWSPPATRSVLRLQLLIAPLEKRIHRFKSRHRAVAAVTRRLLPIYRVRDR